jgi:hypothetical protein
MSSPAITGTAVRGVVAALVAGILAVTFLPLGIAFAILGAAGSEEAFAPLGLSFVVAGAALGLVAWLSRRAGKRREAAETAARISRGTAQVLEARLNPYSRVGTRNPMKLAVQLAGARVERTLYVAPTTAYEPGRSIQVAFAPNDPSNFVPLE